MGYGGLLLWATWLRREFLVRPRLDPEASILVAGVSPRDGNLSLSPQLCYRLAFHNKDPSMVYTIVYDIKVMVSGIWDIVHGI